jgi:hypothetical protein
MLETLTDRSRLPSTTAEEVRDIFSTAHSFLKVVVFVEHDTLSVLIASLKARAGAINTLANASPRAAAANGSLTGTNQELRQSAPLDGIECCLLCLGVLPVENHHCSHLDHLLTARGRIETVKDDRAYQPSRTVAALSPSDTKISHHQRLSGASPRSREADIKIGDHSDAQRR